MEDLTAAPRAVIRNLLELEAHFDSIRFETSWKVINSDGSG
jgi:hypothetical protein